MKKNKKTTALLLSISAAALLMAGGCGLSSAKEKIYTEDVKEQIVDMYGFPDVTNFFEYSHLKEIYELRDNPNLICYWYTKNDMSGKWVYQGTCVGYGIPYGASITSPEKYGGNGTTLPLAEPNGLYTNCTSTSATWILGTGTDGKITPVYVESEIIISQSKIDGRLCEEWSLPKNY